MSFYDSRYNPNDLRVILTARTLTDINEQAKQGYWPLVKKINPDEQVFANVEVYQHRTTGQIVLNGDCRFRPAADYQLVLESFRYYPYRFPSPYAAYLIPNDLVVGERVWLDDLIQDVVAVWANQGGNPRLEGCEATWTGQDFTIHFDPAKDAPVLIG